MNTDTHFARKLRVRQLGTDKRVKHVTHCDMCHTPISLNKYLLNGGYCNECISIHY